MLDVNWFLCKVCSFMFRPELSVDFADKSYT